MNTIQKIICKLGFAHFDDKCFIKQLDEYIDKKIKDSQESSGGGGNINLDSNLVPLIIEIPKDLILGFTNVNNIKLNGTQYNIKTDFNTIQNLFKNSNLFIAKYNDRGVEYSIGNCRAFYEDRIDFCFNIMTSTGDIATEINSILVQTICLHISNLLDNPEIKFGRIINTLNKIE